MFLLQLAPGARVQPGNIQGLERLAREILSSRALAVTR